MTGQDILQAEFEKVGMRGAGYKADQVDEFLSNVAKFVDTQEAEKGELEYKIKILAEKIEQYKKEEDNMKEALIGAQTHGKRVVKEARVKAEEMIKQTEHACEKSLNEAKKKADLLTEATLNKAKQELAEIQRDCSRERELLEKFKIETSRFRKSILDQYRVHIAAVQELPSLVDKNLGIKSNAPAPTPQAPPPQQQMPPQPQPAPQPRPPAPPPPAPQPQPVPQANTSTENKAKQILREEENRASKERSSEPRSKPERERPKSRHVQVPKNKLLEDEESKLEKSKTLDFNSENINLAALVQPLQQQQAAAQQAPPPQKTSKNKQDPENKKGSMSNRHVQTERPDYVKKWGDLEFGKNQG